MTFAIISSSHTSAVLLGSAVSYNNQRVLSLVMRMVTTRELGLRRLTAEGRDDDSQVRLK
jgi:hypothetical protein